MALISPGRHEIHGIYHRDRPYKHVENSVRGVRLAKAAGDEGIDIDLQITRDGVIVGCHDNQPLLHGFHDPLRRLPRDMKISEHTWAQVSRLFAVTGGRVYRIRRIERIFSACHRYGRVAVVEPKSDHRFGLDWPWQYMAEEAAAAGTALSARALPELGGVAHTAAAHRADITAWLI